MTIQISQDRPPAASSKGNASARKVPYPKFGVKGKVWLVGGGPGDPELLTCKAKRLLQEAEVVAYDDLINPSVLSLAGPQAELVSVGYRGLRGDSNAPRIHAKVMELALSGKSVIRLKTGDPLIFGRGGEEAQELREAGIPYEIVPGITAAIGSAAYTGIPLTHRGLSSGFTIATGHFARSLGSEVGMKYPRKDSRETLVFYMARKNLAVNLRELIQHGYDPKTPAAFICSGTTRAQIVVEGHIENLADRSETIHPDAPALVIVGEVVTLRSQINWFNRGKTLGGLRILVARARPGLSQLAKSLNDLGADVIEAPFVYGVSLLDPSRGPDQESWMQWLRAVSQLQEWDGVIFSCKQGVTEFISALKYMKKDIRDLPRKPVVAIGTGVSDQLREIGIQPDVDLQGACAQDVGTQQDFFKDKHFLLPSSDRGRPNLEKVLAQFGARYDRVVAYRFLHRYPRVVAPVPDLVVYPSSSAVHALMRGDLGCDLTNITSIVPGAYTAAACQEAGVKQVIVTPVDHMNAVLSEVIVQGTKILNQKK